MKLPFDEISHVWARVAMLQPTNQIHVPPSDSSGGTCERLTGEVAMLDGSRYFAEFPDENPDRAPINPAVLCALMALEREISRIVQTEPERETIAMGHDRRFSNVFTTWRSVRTTY